MGKEFSRVLNIMPVQGKINSRDIRDIIPLSPMQKSMLFQYLKEPDSRLYFEQIGYELTGDLAIDHIKKAWRIVADDNEILRTLFWWNNVRQPVQIILKKKEIPVNEFDLSNLEGDARRLELVRIKKNDVNRKIDLRQDPFRIILCRLSKERCEMILTSHHAILDGWSNAIILNEFLEAYYHLYNGVQPAKSVKSSYKDYIKWQLQQDKRKQREYWQKSLDGFIGSISLGPLRRYPTAACRAEYYESIMPYFLEKKLENFLKKTHFTLAILLYSAWAILLHKYTQSKEVVFGITVSGRKSKLKGIQHMVGLFINTLPLRIKLNPRMAVLELLREVKRLLFDMEEFESTPLADIVEYARKDPGKPLFDSVVVIQNYPVDTQLVSSSTRLKVCLTTKFYMTEIGITLGVRIFDHIVFEFAYNPCMFIKNFIKQLSKNFFSILSQVVDRQVKIENIRLLDQEERDKVISNIRQDKKELEKIEGININELF